VSLIVQHEEKIVKKNKNDDDDIFSDAKTKSHSIKDDLEIQNEVNLDNSRSLELNIVDNIGVGFGASSSSNNPLDGNDSD